MGEQVEWTSKERVDVPDMKAMGSVQESEFRRHVRGALLGVDDTNSIIKGFEVEPDSPVSSRILVRLDRSADAVPFQTASFALGGQNLGGGSIDHGVLIGGKNSADEFEGPAQVILDFSAQAFPVTYTVEMRFSATPGDLDNRAFWDEVANSEFIRSTNTRIKPVWELRLSGPASPEWTPLADVAWDGGTIDPADITDLRVFTHEGSAAAFDFTAQSAPASFDFDRASDRGTFGVTIGGIHSHLAALNRQIMDIKGQSTAGFFNWYDRVFKAPGPSGFATEQTKSLRTIDTVSYTIGDGGLEFGDFNGPTGLQDCLDHIVANAGDIPQRVQIILKNRLPGSMQVFTPVVIADKHLEIIGGPGGLIATPTSANPIFGLGQIGIQFTNPAFSVAITLTGNCSLTLKNLVAVNGIFGAIQNNMFLVEGGVIADNCFISGYNAGFDEFAIQCRSDGTKITNCEIEGVCNIGGTRDINTPTGGHIKNTKFNRCVLRLRFTDATAGLAVVDVLEIRAANLAFEECSFTGRTSDPHFFGTIDARGAEDIRFDNCAFSHSADENGIYFGTLPTTTQGIPTEETHVEDSRFNVFSDNTHDFLLGVNGADGSGHHIFSRSPGLTGLTEIVRGIHIEGNEFIGSGNQSPDGMSIQMYSPRNVWIKKNQFRFTFAPLVGYSIAHIFFPDEGAGFDGQNIWCEENFHGDWGNAVAFVNCVSATGLDDLHVNRNTFDRRQSVGTISDHSNAALRLDDCIRPEVSDNTFFAWRSPGAPLNNTSITLHNIISAGMFKHNTFVACGGHNILADQAGPALINRCGFEGNIFQVGEISANFSSAIFLALASTGRNWFYDNKWDYDGALHLAIDMGSTSRGALIGNWFENGSLSNALLTGGTATNLIGYPEVSTFGPPTTNAGDRVNLFSSYI